MWHVSDEALAALVEYCLREAHGGAVSTSGLSALPQSRIPLLYSCCGVSRLKMRAFFSILEGKRRY